MIYSFCIITTSICNLLQLAARNGHSNIIKLLVETGGADVQERNMTTGRYSTCIYMVVDEIGGSNIW